MMKLSYLHGVRVRLANGRIDLVPARTFKVEHGVLLLSGPQERAYAPGSWEYAEYDYRDHKPGFDG